MDIKRGLVFCSLSVNFVRDRLCRCPEATDVEPWRQASTSRIGLGLSGPLSSELNAFKIRRCGRIGRLVNLTVICLQPVEWAASFPSSLPKSSPKRRCFADSPGMRQGGPNGAGWRLRQFRLSGLCPRPGVTCAGMCTPVAATLLGCQSRIYRAFRPFLPHRLSSTPSRFPRRLTPCSRH